MNFEIINPYDASLVASVPYTTSHEWRAKLEIVKNKGRDMQRSLSPFERSVILNQIASLLKRDREILSLRITNEMGKTITDARLEIDRAALTFRHSAIEATQIVGEILPTNSLSNNRTTSCLVNYAPMGVVLCITPFNFPINLAAHKIGPAFAAGNTILLKPNPQTYQSTEHLLRLCIEAGMPIEGIQWILPDVSEMEQIIQSEDIDAISFTGSYPVARAIASKAGIKKLLLELGGNDPIIVMSDGDVERAALAAIQQRFGCAGQRCTAAKKVYIHEDRYQEFKKLLIEKSKKLVIGDPKDGQTFIGPVVSKKAAELIMQRIAAAIEEGATHLLGNERVGNIIHPTILENVSLKSELIKDETFGPVLPLFSFRDHQEVIKSLNSTPFGLQAGLFTDNFNVIKDFQAQLNVGAIIVNEGPGFRLENLPFGGQKQSGLGREGVRYAIREMSVTKSLIY
ncbi:MAG: aldehyde dehydrogenase family protein [Bacteriovoracaceae bacterium]|nr:aldehyde dehydrogenase family protein [Bacteriovoracaceae bacterium]